ncbi:NADPH-dependent FMN reductase [Arachidicoccus sp.]|uniref:NADPH-dependent FMN reductase n=1 Tax=Arachidicoccus sp. TaxID=1872624 RepID=UPI003D1FDB11
MNIEIVSGSSREESITLRAALHLEGQLKEKAPQHHIGLIDLREYSLPFMDGVFSSPEKAPVAFYSVAKRMFDADAFILVSPEYNGSFAPTLSNWFNHFPKQLHKAFGLVTASDGALGGIRAALQLQHYALALFGVPSAQMLVIGQVDKKFTEDGTLLTEVFKSNVDNFAAEFLWLAEKLKQ